MPIYTNDKGCKTITFGTGDILIHKTLNDEPLIENGLCFKVHEPRAIGERTEEYAGNKLDDFYPEVHFIFEKSSSIDVLIEMLQEIKQNMNRPEDIDSTEIHNEAEANP